MRVKRIYRSIVVFATFVIFTLSIGAQVLPQVCTLRGVLGTAPANGTTGNITTMIWQSGTASSTCSGVVPPNPFNFGTGNFRYNTHTLKNPSIFPICVPVRLTKTNPSVSGADLQVVVFQAPFVSGDITNSARFLGDAGTSTGAFAVWEPSTFNVVIPANSSVALVVYNLVSNSTAAEPYQLDFCTYTTNYSGGGVSIPDNNPNGVNIPLTVSTSGRISDVNFRFFTFGGVCDATPGNGQAAVNHTFVGDLTFRLTTPSGAVSSTFWQRRGGTRENICSTTIDDEGGFPALSTITSQTGQTVSGSYSPEEFNPLSRFDGQSPQGTWTLNVSDNVAEDTGIFRRFGLDITTIPRKAPFDFDGDGRTDVSIYRPNVGEWWVLRSSNGTNFATQFGNSSDRTVPGDFTGDGVTDIAFWRPSSGEWYVLRSEDFSFFAFPFGASGDIPVPGDYDGDTWTDAAVYRPSSNTWFISKSSGGVDIRGFGAAGDKPVPADYDGDGKVDIAIYRPSGAVSGEWWGIYSRNSSSFVRQFGAATDKPVHGDYTGDGRADIAIWRPSTGFWFVMRSENDSFYSVPFGANGDAPVPGDYDGDGKFDTAVFRPSNSTWFAQRSNGGGPLIQSFGQAGDIPTPSSYVP